MICRHVLVFFTIAGYILGVVSLFTLSAISVNRLLALLLGLRYRQVVTLKRIYLIVSTLSWVVATGGSAIYFWNFRITLWCIYIGTSLCLVTSAVCYTKILSLRHNGQVQAQSLVNQGQPSHSFTEQSAIQKDSDKCTVGAVSSSCFLFTMCYTGSFSPRRKDPILFRRSAFFAGSFSSLKLVIKPNCLLLED